MTEPAKPKLRWTSHFTYLSYAEVGVFTLRVSDALQLARGTWQWSVRVDDAVLRSGRAALPTREAAQVAAEAALREMLTGALKALDGGT